jgi:hypothetical protein
MLLKGGPKKEHLEKELKKSQSHNGMWPSSYYRPQYKYGPLDSNAIFTNILNAFGRIEAHLRYVNGKDS